MNKRPSTCLDFLLSESEVAARANYHAAAVKAIRRHNTSLSLLVERFRSSRGYTLHFCSQVTSAVLQHYGPRLGVGGEISLHRSNLPTHRDHDFKVFGIAWQYRWGGGY